MDTPTPTPTPTKLYSVEVVSSVGGNTLLNLKFGAPATNAAIVPAAVEEVKNLNLIGGKILRLNGAASLPVAIAIGHEVGHKFGVIACYDPKLVKYVVSVSHDPEFKLGDLID